MYIDYHTLRENIYNFSYQNLQVNKISLNFSLLEDFGIRSSFNAKGNTRLNLQ